MGAAMWSAALLPFGLGLRTAKRGRSALSIWRPRMPFICTKSSVRGQSGGINLVWFLSERERVQPRFDLVRPAAEQLVRQVFEGLSILLAAYS
jgi:hypothetical protein